MNLIFVSDPLAHTNKSLSEEGVKESNYYSSLPVETESNPFPFGGATFPVLRWKEIHPTPQNI
jgi:hypothetical protein